MSVTAEQLKETFDAFNRHDIDGIMAHFADDCVFYTVAGDSEFGNKIEGAEAIAAAFSAVWAGMEDAQWAEHSHFVAGDRGVSEWTFRGTDKDGNRIEAQGADIFTFRDGKIIVKQALRKQRPAFKV